MRKPICAMLVVGPFWEKVCFSLLNMDYLFLLEGFHNKGRLGLQWSAVVCEGTNQQLLHSPAVPLQVKLGTTQFPLALVTSIFAMYECARSSGIRETLFHCF